MTQAAVEPGLNLTNLGRFVRVSHTLFSLPLVVAGLWIGAGGWPTARVFACGLLAAVGARTAAMALNRIIDRKIDAQNARTASRELPRGALSLAQAWGVALVGGLLYFLGAGLLGRVTLALAPIPLAVFALYPFLKRFTRFCHFGVGIALGLAPLGGWLAVRQSFDGWLSVLPLGLFGVAWVAGFDIIYATLDEEFDRRAGIHSMPAALGRTGALRASALLHLLAFAALVQLVIVQQWSRWTLVPLVLCGLLLLLEQRCAENVDLAFFRINLVIGFAVAAMVAIGVFLR
ncbi:MAG: 4-hydroxybenzoate octaprenyltransferase [Candidatus Eisenbacteria bacterium]|nr:4-hydroxybenzoate octaprenyltransferase [Candidatus Eisenbacteria bacterium]MCC7142134.1 4-hydroxybenzoate octaprenyltransferase [Candidatus Eisenbacteria bacterium]